MRLSAKHRAIRDEEHYNMLCTKFPNIQPKQGECLNIAANIKRIFTGLYTEGYFMKEITSKMGILEKTGWLMARRYNLPYRSR